MKTLIVAAALTVAAMPALAQGYNPASPEVGVKGAVAGQSQAAGMGTPQVSPNGSSYVPTNRGAATDLTTGSTVPAAGVNPSAERPSFNPAADGNAAQQAKPVPNTGTVSGGPAAATRP